MAKKNNQIQYVLDQIKNEIAAEMGIELSGNTSSRLNGSVGGEMTKRLVALAEDILNKQQ
jgi:hypothetical protein